MAQELLVRQNSWAATIRVCGNRREGALGKDNQDALRACLAQLPAVNTASQHALSTYCVPSTIASVVLLNSVGPTLPHRGRFHRCLRVRGQETEAQGAHCLPLWVPHTGVAEWDAPQGPPLDHNLSRKSFRVWQVSQSSPRLEGGWGPPRVRTGLLGDPEQVTAPLQAPFPNLGSGVCSDQGSSEAPPAAGVGEVAESVSLGHPDWGL